MPRHEPAVVNAAEAKEAESAVKALGRIKRAVRVRVKPEGAKEDVPVPAKALRLLVEILSEMAKGNAVTILPVHAELTTQQAADVLNVSRPYLIKLLDEKKIPHRKVGNRRKVRVSDLFAFKKKDDAERDAVVAELTAEGQNLGLGY